MLERLAKDKHSSLLRKSVNYGQKKFYNIGPRSAKVSGGFSASGSSWTWSGSGINLIKPLYGVIWYKLQTIMNQVALNKSSLMLKTILQNAQTLQLFMMMIKTESIYKSN